MSRFGYWSIRTVLAPEPYIDLAVEPGQQFTWTWTCDYLERCRTSFRCAMKGVR